MASGVETSSFAVGPRREVTAERSLEGTLMWVEPVVEASVISRVSGDAVNMQIVRWNRQGRGLFWRDV